MHNSFVKALNRENLFIITAAVVFVKKTTFLFLLALAIHTMQWFQLLLHYFHCHLHHQLCYSSYDWNFKAGKFIYTRQFFRTTGFDKSFFNQTTLDLRWSFLNRDLPVCISLIFDKCPDRVMTSITTKPNILQKTLFYRFCPKFIKV